MGTVLFTFPQPLTCFVLNKIMRTQQLLQEGEMQFLSKPRLSIFPPIRLTKEVRIKFSKPYYYSLIFTFLFSYIMRLAYGKVIVSSTVCYSQPGGYCHFDWDKSLLQDAPCPLISPTKCQSCFLIIMMNRNTLQIFIYTVIPFENHWATYQC